MVLTRGQKDRRIQLDGLVCRVCPEAVVAAEELEEQKPAEEAEARLEPAPKRRRVWVAGSLRREGEPASSSAAGTEAEEEDWPLG